MASNRWTSRPAARAVSAAINPAGPPPMMAIVAFGMVRMMPVSVWFLHSIGENGDAVRTDDGPGGRTRARARRGPGQRRRGAGHPATRTGAALRRARTGGFRRLCRERAFDLGRAG